MTIGWKCLAWSALGVVLLAAGYAQSPQGPAARQDSTNVAGKKGTASESPRGVIEAGSATTVSHSNDMPRKVILGTVLTGYEGVFDAPLDKRLDKMDETVAAMAAELARKYPGKRLDLAMLPETFLGRPAKDVAQQAVPLDEVRERVGACARRHDCYLIVPMVLQVHLAGGEDVLEGGTTPGREFPVFDCDFGRLGIQICWDVMYNDGWEALARQGAEIVAWTSASALRARPAMYAQRHRYYVVNSSPNDNANVLNPLGMPEAEIAQPGVLVHQIDLAYALVHWSQDLDKGRAFSRRFGDRVGFHFYDREITGIFWSNDPAMSIGQMMASLGMRSLDDEVERTRLLQDKARGGPPVMPPKR